MNDTPGWTRGRSFGVIVLLYVIATTIALVLANGSVDDPYVALIVG